MADFALIFACDTRPFSAQAHVEIARILRVTAEKLDQGLRLMRDGTDSDPVRDYDNKPVGKWVYRARTPDAKHLDLTDDAQFIEWFITVLYQHRDAVDIAALRQLVLNPA